MPAGLAAPGLVAHTEPSCAPHVGAPWFVDLLRCPDCRAPLDGTWGGGTLSCSRCARAFLVAGQLSAFVSDAVVRDLAFPALHNATALPAFVAPPDGGYQGPLLGRVNPRHLSLLAARAGRLDVLDWGCGPADYRAPIERLGHRYVGVDREGTGADILTDVHSLPLANDSVDHVITNAVLEHVANPFLALREVARILKPGGVFSGSVAFLEPRHADSRFHLTADAVVEVLRYAGLEVDAVWPQEDWLVFDSLATMPGPVSAPSRVLLRLVSRFERVTRRRYLHPREVRRGRWLRRKSPSEYQAELLEVTGQVDFLARKR